MNFQMLKDRGADCFNVAIRSLNNLALGTLIGVSRTRERNYENTGSCDIAKGEMQGQRENGMAEDHTEEVGFDRPITPTKRGDLYASLAASCVQQAEEQGIDPSSFDWPLSFQMYIENRAKRLRSTEPSSFEVTALSRSLLIEKAEAKQLLVMGLLKQAGELEEDKEMLVNSMNDYEAVADEAVFDRFSLVDQHRMFVKVIDGLVYEADRLKGPIGQYGTPGRPNPFTDDLTTKRFLLIDDAIELLGELDKFERTHRTAINVALAGTDRMLTRIAPSNARTIEMVKRMRREERLEREETRRLEQADLHPNVGTMQKPGGSLDHTAPRY